MKENQQQHRLRISISQQQMEVLEVNPNEPGTFQLVTRYPISSSKFGLGTEEGSYKTPLGQFIIAKKIGDGEPERMIFSAREPTGKVAPLGGTHDDVLTRILWLKGIEPHNTNTQDRFIYIHGTNQEELIGTPASHGCIRLRNAEMIKLFDSVQEGCPVEILNE